MKTLQNNMKFKVKYVGVTIVIVIGLFAIIATNRPPVSRFGTMTDQDGNKYQTVKIGSQYWMAENLKVTHYRNGDPIPNVTDVYEWVNLSIGAYCVYDNDTSHAETHGYLYNWHAVHDIRHIAPEGWHVPTDNEWKELEMHLGMSQTEADGFDWRGTDEGDKLKSTSGWVSEGNGTNESGISAIPSGERNGSGVFNSMGSKAAFWSSTNDNGIWGRTLWSSHSDIRRNKWYERLGFSVRLVRDN